MTPQLTTAGANALLNKPDAPVLFVLWYRAGKGKKWAKVGRAGSHAEAVNMIGGGGVRGGDWHIAPLVNADLAGDGLFADDSPADATQEARTPSPTPNGPPRAVRPGR